MENKFTTIKERVLEVIEHYGYTKTEFCAKIGITTANLRGNARKTPLNSDALEKIFSLCPNISPDWLIMGTGEMMRGAAQSSADQPDNTDSVSPAFEVLIRTNDRLAATNQTLAENNARLMDYLKNEKGINI